MPRRPRRPVAGNPAGCVSPAGDGGCPQGLPAGDIAERLDARQNTMSTNLAILNRAGLISRQRDGRSVRYAANYDGMRDLINFLMMDCCRGAPEVVQPVAASCA